MIPVWAGMTFSVRRTPTGDRRAIIPALENQVTFSVGLVSGFSPTQRWSHRDMDDLLGPSGVLVGGEGGELKLISCGLG